MKKENIYFLHSNGFGAKTYSFFLQQFSPRFDVFAVDLIGHNAYPPQKNWKPLADELIAFIVSNGHTEVVAIGHSLGGAVAMFALQKRPDLFKKVFFLDPPLFAYHKRKIGWLLKQLGFMDNISPAGRAKNRRRFFESKEEARQYFASKKLFKNFHPRCFDDYIQYGLKESEKTNNGFELTFSPDIEYQIFRELPISLGKLVFEKPTFFIYVTSHQTLEKIDVRWLRRNLKNTKFIPFDGGHLFPLEQPIETAAFLQQFIEKE